MGAVKVSPHPPPRLGNGVYYKDIPWKNEMQFVDALATWIASFVGRTRALHLVVQAAGFNDIIAHISHAPVSMGLNGPKPWRVHVEFYWGRTSTKQWLVTGLGLHIKDSVNNIANANQAAERERLHNIYEEKQIKSGIPARKACFQVEIYSDHFDDDLVHGRAVTQILIDQAYEVGKGLAQMPTNPIGPNPDDPFSILMATVGAGAGETINALSHLGYSARAIYEGAKTAVELGDKVRGRAADNSPVAALADLVEIGLSLSKFAGPWAPFASIILGSFVEIAIANQAGPVTRVRSHMYSCFVGGVVKELTNTTSIKPARPGDQVFFDFGIKRARKISAERQYDLQVALMEYALRHPIGEWNLNPMYKGAPPFPEAYIRYWSPQMLERSLLVQLCKAQYLYK